MKAMFATFFATIFFVAADKYLHSGRHSDSAIAFVRQLGRAFGL